MRLTLHGLTHTYPPGPGKFPYLDFRQGLAMRRNPVGTFLQYYHEYGPAFTLRFPGLQMVFLVGPEANQYITVSNYRDFSWGDGFYGELIPFVGRGLLTTDDDIHDRARRLLVPVFAPPRIRAYADQMVARAAAFADRLRPDERFELHEWTRTLALKIAGDVLFGIDTDERLAMHFAHHFEEGLNFYGGPYFTTLVLRGPRTPFEKMRTHVAELHKTVQSEIARRRASGSNGDNILDIMLNARDDGDALTDTEVRDHSMTLLFAGHDTTSATLSWMFTLLGRNPQVYRKLQSEIDAALPGRDPSADDLIGGLPYLDMVLKETLRLYPAAWFGPRKARKDFHMYGHDIAAGTQVTYSSWLTHRLPHLWPDPDAFDPERFTTERVREIQPGAYVPFGRGPRLCIGMRFGELEVKAIAATLLRRHHFELFPGQDFSVRTVPTISPKYGVQVVVRARQAAHTPALQDVASGGVPPRVEHTQDEADPANPAVASAPGCPVRH